MRTKLYKTNVTCVFFFCGRVHVQIETSTIMYMYRLTRVQLQTGTSAWCRIHTSARTDWYEYTYRLIRVHVLTVTSTCTGGYKYMHMNSLLLICWMRSHTGAHMYSTTCTCTIKIHETCTYQILNWRTLLVDADTSSTSIYTKHLFI